MKRIATIATIATGLALALAGCAGTPGGNTTSKYTGPAIPVVKAGSLTVCSDSPYKPFEYEDSSTPTGYTGFDVDIMTAIAESVGLKLVIVDTDFDSLQSGLALAAKQCDIGASAITITDDRKANLDFSDPYYDSLQSLLVPKTSSVKSLDDMAGMKIGVQAGTTGEIYANQHKPASATLVGYPSDGEMWPALQAGAVDALLQDFPINNQHVKDDPNYVVVASYQTSEQYGFAMTKGGNPTLLAAVNATLKAMRADGRYDTIYKKYFS